MPPENYRQLAAHLLADDEAPEPCNPGTPIDEPKSRRCRCGNCPVVQNRWLYRKPGDQTFQSLEEPFSTCPETVAEAIGQRIACEYGLHNLKELFTKAASVIGSPIRYEPLIETYEEISNDQDPHGPLQAPPSNLLSHDEIIALRNKSKRRFWDQPWPLRTTCYMLFVAAIVQGWCQTNTNGAYFCWLNPLFNGADLDETAMATPDMTYCGPGSRPKYALVDAAVFLFAPIGCWCSDPLNELVLGRRRALMVSATVILAGSIASATMKQWWALLICRALVAVGLGSKAAVTPVFIAEIAPSHLRGTMLVNWQVFDAFGIFLGFSANLLSTYAGINTWRWQFASAAIPSFALLLGTIFIRLDSPRFDLAKETIHHLRYDRKRTMDELQKKLKKRQTSDPEKRDQHWTKFKLSYMERLMITIRSLYGPDPTLGYRSNTFETLVMLRGHKFLAAMEIVRAQSQLIIQRLSYEKKVNEDDDIDFSLPARPRGWFTRLWEILTVKHLQREMAACAVIMLAQQLSGINVLILYSSRLFSATAARNGDGAVVYTYDLYSIRSVWLTWGIGLANFLMALPAYWWIESFGRRRLILFTLPALAVLMVAATASFSIPPSYQSGYAGQQAAVGIFAFLFVLVYSPGLGPVPWSLCAETFPLEHRMIGVSLAVSLNFLVGGCLALSIPYANEQVLLAILAGLNVLSFVACWVFLREPEKAPLQHRPWDSKCLRLEEMYHIFKPTHKQHVQFQMLRTSKAWETFRTGRKPEDDERYFLTWMQKQNSHQSRITSDSSLRSSAHRFGDGVRDRQNSGAQRRRSSATTNSEPNGSPREERRPSVQGAQIPEMIEERDHDAP